MPISHSAGGTTYTGEAITYFALITLRQAIKVYAQTGMRVNNAYTPLRMKNTAERWTGRKFKRGDWTAMLEALDARIAEVQS